jgi:2-oxoisovalerate dehydrogenase E1 component alpha subunit
MVVPSSPAPPAASRARVVVPPPYRPVPSDLDGPTPADRHTALGLAPDLVVEVYRRMVLARRIDERAWNWNRQGRVPFVVPCEGHEATQVGAATMLRVGHDWVCPYYRDLPLMVGLGLPTIGLLAHVLWRADDPHSGGRQMPGHWNDVGRRVLSTSSCIATQIPHALGLGLAEQLRGSDAVALATFGEGATAEGDFHEAVNWAACHLVPVVFLCENNGYAISVPAPFETPVAVAQRATGYGIPGVRVDGNDVFAVMGAVARAVARAPRRDRSHDRRGDDVPVPAAHERRRRPPLPHPRGGGGVAGRRPARAHAPLPARPRAHR